MIARMPGTLYTLWSFLCWGIYKGRVSFLVIIDVAEKALHLCVTTNESKERAIDPTSDSYDVTFDYRHLENYYGMWVKQTAVI